MTYLDWARWGARYLLDARLSRIEDFKGAIEENKGWQSGVPRGVWREVPRSLIAHLYSFSQELVADTDIPGSVFSTPGEFESKIVAAKAFVEAMRPDLARALDDAKRRFKPIQTPDHIAAVGRLMELQVETYDFILSHKPSAAAAEAGNAWQLVQLLAARFHESVLTLKKHPHGGATFAVEDEWDAQYLFRFILTAYFADLRIEEWSPSVAGSSARCEFYLKDHRLMVEMKYVRGARDQSRIKTELARDILDYGGNPAVDRLCVMIYDPEQQLGSPAQLEADLSGPHRGLLDLAVKISPPRG